MPGEFLFCTIILEPRLRFQYHETIGAIHFSKINLEYRSEKSHRVFPECVSFRVTSESMSCAVLRKSSSNHQYRSACEGGCCASIPWSQGSVIVCFHVQRSPVLASKMTPGSDDREQLIKDSSFGSVSRNTSCVEFTYKNQYVAASTRKKYSMSHYLCML